VSAFWVSTIVVALGAGVVYSCMAYVLTRLGYFKIDRSSS
jgi:hypothetical protein